MPRAKSMSAWLVSGHKGLIQEKNIIASGLSSLKVDIQELGLHGDFENHGSVSFNSSCLDFFLILKISCLCNKI